MSISENLTRLQNAKDNIGTAITNNGGTIETTDGLEEYPTRIRTRFGEVNDTLSILLKGPTLITKTINENGTYDAEDDNADGYSEVTVNVPTGGYEVTVTTLANATVTLTKTGTTYTATADSNGIATFIGVTSGTYTVQASITSNDFTALSDTTTITISDYNETEDTFATISITASDNCDITITNNGVSKTVSYLAGATITQYASLNSTWDISATIDSTLITRTIAITSYSNQSVYLSASKTYGWHIDPSISDPANAVTYLEDAIDLTPASMGSTTFSYGSWQDAFFMPKPCMVNFDGTVAYYLDPNDYTKKTDGTASDISNTNYSGNAMMQWPKIWYKFVAGSSEGEGSFYVSDRQVDNTYDCWCNYDYANNQIDHFYTPIYNGYVDNNNKLRSLSGIGGSNIGSITATNYITYAQNCNTNNSYKDWYIGTFSDRILINSLLILMGKSLNTQAVFGNGFVNGTKSNYTTGALNDKGLFYGTTANQTTGVKVFGMENWWGFVYQWTAGLMASGSSCYYKITRGTHDGSTTTDYGTTSTTGYFSGGTLPTSSPYYTTKMTFTNNCFYPKNTGGSNSTYYCDYFYVTTSSGTYFSYFGGCYDGLLAGAFYCSLYYSASDSLSYIAAAPYLKPQVRQS